MTREEAIKYALSKKGAEETYPFDETTLVFKVGGKMFGLVYEREGEVGLNLKCDPDFSQVLRQQYEGVFPGYHMNKEHWNTVILDESIPEPEINRMIDESYRLEVKSLKKSDREKLKD